MAEEIETFAYSIKQFLARVIKVRKPETASELHTLCTTEDIITKFLLKYLDVIYGYNLLKQSKLATANKQYYKKNQNLHVVTFNKKVQNTLKQYFEDIISKNLIHHLVLKAIMYYYPDELKGCSKLRKSDKNIKNHKDGFKVLITGINVIDKVNDKIIIVLKDLINKETLPLPIEKCIIRAIKIGSKNQAG